MLSYPALVDGEKGAYGVSFPDLPGIVAMGETVEEALASAENALLDYAIEAEADGEEIVLPSPLETIETLNGQRLVSIPLPHRNQHETQLLSSLRLKRIINDHQPLRS